MAAPAGNQFWKMRAKHGRDHIFKTPEALWEAAQEYFEATDERKWNRTEFNGKDAVKCDVPIETPYTLTGLCLFLGVNTAYFRQFKAEGENAKDFSTVIARIEEIIYTQKFEGAAVGIFQPMIIARDLGLAEKNTTTLNVEQPLFNLTDESNNGDKKTDQDK